MKKALQIVFTAVATVAASLLVWRTVEKSRATEDLWAEAERFIK